MSISKLSLDQLTVMSFETSISEPLTLDDSAQGMCTCIDICPTDGTCIAYGCA